uniref:Mitochondrial ribosomal protein L1 n=1 Tax=Molossus molossus TaxID=27622 RepID=A0A7J8JY80_MOLMO|nr:mitochondrial ribosomal protein L1 [Molossus molossus]
MAAILTDSIGRDIPKMLELFKTGHEIEVDEERENFLKTKIATWLHQSAFPPAVD